MKFGIILSICFLAISLFVFMSCDTTKNTQSTTDTPVTTDTSTPSFVGLEMSKSPCFGECPVFVMTIDEKGLVTYKGVRFTNKQGVHTKTLAPNAFAALKTSVSKMNLFQYENSYPSNIPDLPTTTIIYSNSKDSKKIAGNINRPEAIVLLEKELDLIANSTNGWAMIEAPESEDDYMIYDEIIVQLKAGVDINEWIKEFEPLGLTIKKRIAPNSSMWLLTYDTEQMDPDNMLKLITDKEEVEVAEFNKKISPRK